MLATFRASAAGRVHHHGVGLGIAPHPFSKVARAAHAAAAQPDFQRRSAGTLAALCSDAGADLAGRLVCGCRLRRLRNGRGGWQNEHASDLSDLSDLIDSAVRVRKVSGFRSSVHLVIH